MTTVPLQRRALNRQLIAGCRVASVHNFACVYKSVFSCSLVTHCAGRSQAHRDATVSWS